MDQKKLYTAFFIFNFLFSFSNCRETEKVCPGIYISPHVRFQFSEPLKDVGTYRIHIQKPFQEKCSLFIKSISLEKKEGSMVRSPNSEYSMDCKNIGVARLNSAGEITEFHAGGTNPDWKWNIQFNGKEIGNWNDLVEYNELKCPDRVEAEALVPIKF